MLISAEFSIVYFIIIGSSFHQTPIIIINLSRMVFVLSCGSNVYSQCCQKGSEKITTLSPITLLPEGVSLVNVKKIACGREHTMMLLRDGRLFGIGHNQHGQIFGKTQAQYSEFLKIDSSSFLSVGDTIVDVFCTQINTYVITECGKIYWSGWENLHSEKNYLKMQNMDGIKSIDYFVTNSNAVHCFISSRMYFDLTKFLTFFIIMTICCGFLIMTKLTICCRFRYCCPFFKDGKLFSCGWNSHGQLR